MNKVKGFAASRHVIPAALAVAAVLALALAACAPVAGPAEGPLPPPPGKGIVNIQLGVDDTGTVPFARAARTLLPAAPLFFGSYDLTFTPQGGGEPVTRNGITGLTGIELYPGTYTLDLKAYSGTEVAAEGTASGVVVTEGKDTQAVVPLLFTTTETGTGTLGVTVTNTSGLTLSQAAFNWMPLSGGTTAGSESLTVSGSGLSGSKSLQAGYYLVTVTLSAGDRTAKRSDASHIGAGQTTLLEWDFDADDFFTDVTRMWLVEKNGSTWGTPGEGNKLDEQADGTFVWQGSLTTGSFRFDLNDETNPGHFQPAVDGAAIELDTPVLMSFTSGDTGPEAAWSLEAGYYRFAVNPLAQTVTVTAVTVTDKGSIAITLEPSELGNTLVVTGPVPASISRSNGSLTISVSGGDFTSYVWILDGEILTGVGQAGASITLESKPGSWLRLGGHSVTVYATTADGAPWSPENPIAFTVEPSPDTPEPPDTPPPAGEPYERLGVYVYDRNSSGVDFFEEWAGRDIKYAEDFLGYDYWQSYTGEWWSDYNPQYWSAWKAANPDKRLVLAVSPFPKNGLAGGYDGAMMEKARTNYQEAAAGNYNTYYRQLGEKLKDLGLGDTIIRFGHEMSGSWYVYSISVGSTEAIKEEKQINYGKAFNEFAKTLKAIEGTNFEFCWNPATDSDPAYLARCYPGDEHVDYIAFDQYDYWMNAYNQDDYHNTDSTSVANEASRRTIQAQAWNQMMGKWGNPNWFAAFAKQHNKPLVIAEWGLWRDNRNSGYDNPYFIEKMYEWINANDVAWHVYFMFGDVSHSLYDTVGYPLASAKFQELWNPSGSRQTTPAIPPSGVNGYNSAAVKRGRDAVFGSNVALVSDPWAWSDGMLAGMWTYQDQLNDTTTITFENCPASNGFALVYQLWYSNRSKNEWDNNQRVSLYVNGQLVQSAINLQHGGRGWGDSYMIKEFDTVTIPAGASIMFKADTGNWAYTRLNFDYVIFK
ncbi:MAG: hypothetical protein LBH57_08900 [Treponema sp.]|jgi:hypothetical protein|nr:hypothetical protein [Treponema sp.]